MGELKGEVLRSTVAAGAFEGLTAGKVHNRRSVCSETESWAKLSKCLEALSLVDTYPNGIATVLPRTSSVVAGGLPLARPTNTLDGHRSGINLGFIPARSPTDWHASWHRRGVYFGSVTE